MLSSRCSHMCHLRVVSCICRSHVHNPHRCGCLILCGCHSPDRMYLGNCTTLARHPPRRLSPPFLPRSCPCSTCSPRHHLPLLPLLLLLLLPPHPPPLFARPPPPPPLPPPPHLHLPRRHPCHLHRLRVVWIPPFRRPILSIFPTMMTSTLASPPLPRRSWTDPPRIRSTPRWTRVHCGLFTALMNSSRFWMMNLFEISDPQLD
mmetsp:Transcript_40729/g.102538  ORF Transcript_40729/g.102538 Transcript_40729/m.102538 type:complete len:204 (+) Transcript_40729:1075-1686(+)